MRYPVDKVFVTQEWGVNPDIYARFGLKGHNGVDYRLFDKNGNRATTAEVFAPHHGTVIEAGFDANGYGNYLKIENDKEGSILAHLASFRVTVGQNVPEGQLVAIANNTGFSTGAHLHWGYYPIPRFRGNGYSGTINQLPILKAQPITPPPDNSNRQIITDILLAMKGKALDDEIDGWVKRFENPVVMIQEILKGDGGYHDLWVKPLIDTAKLEIEAIYQSQIQSANGIIEALRVELKQLREQKTKDWEAVQLIKEGLKKLLGLS